MAGFVYILTNKRNGTLYTGVTADIARRMDEHRHRPEGFVAQYGLSQLVFYETHPRIEDAIQRETSIKRWPRKWKLKLIEELNPEWRDLIEELNQ
ncbi:MAG: GIY-YIG nuclease family protein [Hyphomicrobiaceae bacterium]|nr:GIY-YIG nuclease family protein [Hyphomicrobiaceae bacterium]